MSNIFNSTLLCDENKDLCFDDLEINGVSIDDHHVGCKNPNKNGNQSRPLGNANGSEPLISEEIFCCLLERENDYLPKQDYLTRLRCGELDLCARREAFDWIWKAHSYYRFGPLSLCLAVNYLDRFLSIRELPKDNGWAVQLLAVACLSIAAKIEETNVPQSIELQVGDPKFVFEAKTIQRMELLVLDSLNWKMNAVTPCSFLDCSYKKLSDEVETDTSSKLINRSMQLILCSTRGIGFLEFKPSEIAAAVAMSVSAEDIDKACIHLKKDRVWKCVEMMKNMPVFNKMEAVPQSPSGVLDSAGFSYKSEGLTTVESFPNSSSPITATTAVATTTTTMTTTNSINCGPETKRKKLDTSPSTSG